MTTAVAQEQETGFARLVSDAPARLRMPLCTFVLALCCVLVHGYHPYGEDGGVYLSGIKWLLQPQLYKAWNGFVTAHLRLSLLPYAVASLVRATQLSTMSVVFLLYIASIWLTLVAAWQLASRCLSKASERAGAVLLLATWLSVPVAGTSLMLVDPYLTARSFSTPFGIFALVGVFDFIAASRPKARRRAFVSSCCMLLFSAAMHPLMSIYTLFCMTLFCSLSARASRRGLYTATVVACVFLAAAVVYLAAPASPSAYVLVAHTRTYWFLDQWRWFEWIGLLAPFAIFSAAAFCGRRSPAVLLAKMAAIAGLCSAVVALLFARTGAPSMLIASLQPLRQLQLLYVLMILGLGAAFDRWAGRRRKPAWAVVILTTGCMMFFVQRQTYPGSRHIEAPWRAARNPWEQAFEWVRTNTPQDAVFAIAPDYTSHNDEDAQNFRAIAERSSLPDYSKDGGIASITPELAAEWKDAQRLGEGLNELSDAALSDRLRSTPAQWIVLPATSGTRLTCAFSNVAAKVCRLR